MPVTNRVSFTDIHCHLLPGIDDGAPHWEETLAMAQMALADGTSTIVATPHQLGNHARNSGDTIRARCAECQAVLEQQGLPLQVLPGADVRIEPDLVRKIARGEVLTLADRGRHVLLELPHEVYLPLDRLLGELAAAGLVGILSHPERNLGLLRQSQMVERLVDAGCLMQVTAGSMVGTFGPQSQAMSEWMLAQGLVHFLATDAHSSTARRPLMQRAFERVVELSSRETAFELCSRNPLCVASGQDVARGRRKPARGGLAGWFRWRKAG
jgi:protein-tyrosine phosphatase